MRRTINVPINDDESCYRHIKVISLVSLSQSLIERAYAELQAQIKEEAEEAKKIKAGDWIIVTAPMCFTGSHFRAGEILITPVGLNGTSCRKLTPEEVARLPKP